MGIEFGQDTDKEEKVNRLWSRIEQPTRQVAGLSGEVATGLALDAKTQGLLAGGPWGWLGYGAINFAGGAVSNIAAQKLRQEEDINWGEVVSSGFLGIIPGTSLRFGRKATRVFGKPNTYQRAATFGTAQGMTDQVIRQGINEGRLPTAGELTTGAVTGGVAGPIFKKSFDEIGKIYTKYQGKSAEEVNSLLTKRERSSMSYYRKLYLENLDNPKALREIYELKKESDFNYQKDVLGLHKDFKNYQQYKQTHDNIVNRLNDNLDGIPLQQRLIFAQSGMRGGKLDVDQMRSQGWMGAATSRYGLETFQTRKDQFVPDFFEEEKRRLLPGFIAEYAPYLRSKGVSEDQIDALRVGQHVNLHHITPLKSGADLYHGTDYGDAEWIAVTDIFNEFDLFPGAPATAIPSLKNWLYVLQEPHNLLHHQFLKDNIGLQGEVFFTPERKALLRSGIEGRKQVAREYAAIIRRGKDLIEDMMDQFQIAFGQTNPSPEKLTEILHRSLEDGTIPLLEEGYSLRSKEEIARKIIEVSDLVRAQYDAEFIEPIRRMEALAEAREAAQSAETQARIVAEDERFAQLNADIDVITQEMASREGTFTRFSSLEDARIKAEELISRYDTSGQLRILHADEMTYEAVVERLARLLYENPNAQF